MLERMNVLLMSVTQHKVKCLLNSTDNTHCGDLKRAVSVGWSSPPVAWSRVGEGMRMRTIYVGLGFG